MSSSDSTAGSAVRWERERLPSWLKMPLAPSARGQRTESLLREGDGLHTICEEARCPNRNHCWSRGTATFLILGDVCTRSCRFCSVKGGVPQAIDPDEPQRLTDATERMGLKHVVVTSVNRDDLEDQGSRQFATSIASLRERMPELRIEVLIPDFRGVEKDIDTVVEARPDVLNHNMETVPRLYRRVRPGARYQRSLDLLARARAGFDAVSDGVRRWTKSGFMLGLGESDAEIDALLVDLKKHGVEIVTIGQYLQPGPGHLSVERYVPPEEFERWEARGHELGFPKVFSGPFVRSSYEADTQVPDDQVDGDARLGGDASP